MKRIKIFSLLALTAFAVASFNACKGDKEDDNTNDDAVVFTDGDVQYKMSLSELKDNDSELSFNQVIEYIKPIDLKEDITFTFKYSSDSVAASDSASSDKKSLPITEASMVIDCGSESNAQMVRDSMLTDTVSYNISVEGSKVICTYKKEVLENMTYAAAEAFYNELAKKLGDQRKKNDANKAKEENDAKKQEAENNRKTNYNFDKDSVGAVISTDSTISYTLVKSGVAAVYNFTFDKNTGMITSGSVVCVCKNSDVAKAYAKEHMKDKNANGQLLFKSINLDGSNVIMVYSDSAIAGLNKRDIVAAQQSGKEPDASSIGSNTDVEENNEGENNGENTENQQEENNNSQNSENEQNGNGNNQNTENNQSENNQSENNQNENNQNENNQNESNNSENTELTPEENSNIKPGENEQNNNGENVEPNIPETEPENGENEEVASIVGRWVASSIKLVGEGVDLSAPVDENDLDYLDFDSDGNCSNEWFDEGEKVVDRATYSINDTVLKFTWNEDNEMDFYYFSLSGDTLLLYKYCFYCPETETVYESRDHVSEHVEFVLTQKQYVYKRM
jgi:hypothetical protein